MDPLTHQVGFRDREVCGAELGVFRFERPEGYSFRPGQFASVTVATRDGVQTKHFTHSQAPADPYLEVTTRLTGSAFKDALLALRPGDVVGFTGPRGSLTLDPTVGKVAFLVGGVGVTPARSIIRDAVGRGSRLLFVLFHGNKGPECIPFQEELDGYGRSGDGRVRVVHVLERPGAGWNGEEGFITAELVRRHVDPLDGWRWLVAGPPAMLEPMKRVVADLEIPPDRVAVESFAGYE